MRSTTGEHYIALDHVRAVAAFIVVVWHFTHSKTGYPVPFDGAPVVFPLAILDEGHTGVALFMTLSGYLFAKLIDARPIRYAAFLWNRGLRLLPLLACVLLVAGVMAVYDGESLADYGVLLAKGLVLPTLPNGGWSITTEAHFYLILPLLLAAGRRSPLLILGLVVAAILCRSALYLYTGEVQMLSYWTIVGRFDQFALGVFFFHIRAAVARRHVLAFAVFIVFAATYWMFDRSGGFLKMPGYPSTSAFWIVLPTIEGAAYGFLIAWYEGSFRHSPGRLSTIAGRFGELSYSIYLIHFFLVFRAAAFIHENVMPISNFYLATAWATVFFLLMYLPASLSYRFIELPALRLRRSYFRTGSDTRLATRVEAEPGRS